MQLNSTFVFFLFSFLIFLLSSFVQAQVIIKEKVEINPEKRVRNENQVFSFPDTLNNSSGNKSISNSPNYQPDNLQSTFPLPEGGRVTVEILYSEAAENSQINLELRQPNQEILIEYANLNAGFTWVSPDYFANTNFEIGIYWYWENEGTLYQGIEAGAEVSSLGFGEYFIGFEAAGDDWDYNELVVKVKIETYLPIVFIDPPNISTGETSTVTVKKQFFDGRIEDFDAGQLFEFGMMEGCAAGVLISGSDTSNYFNGVTQPVTFLAADSLENDEETVKIGVGVVEQNPLAKMQTKTNTLTQSKNQNIKVKDKNDDTKIDETKINSIIIGSCFGGDFNSDKRSDANLVVEEQQEILLGETKYFAVKRKTETDELKIEEIKTDYGEEPKFPEDADGWEWLKSDVWGTDPIEKLGTKSGVYWEKKWFRGSDNSNQTLSDGMIRLVGRYWEEGKEDSFKVSLKTINEDSFEIKVIKPDKLLSDGQTDSYTKAKDVFNKEYNVDSLCIYYGGKYGIPPQMLKGQMFTESAKKNFGGTTGNGFAPSYRYEAYTTQLFNKVVKRIIKVDTNPFIVSETAMGKPGAANVPTTTEHEHVLFYHYFQEPKTVWEIIEENSSLVDVNNNTTIYGFQYKGTGADSLKKGQLKSGSYSIVGNTYMDYLKGPKDEDGNRSGGYEDSIKTKYSLKPEEELSLTQQIEANDSARIATINYLKYDYKGGLDSIVAQTRIASSYGLLQSLYVTVEDEHNYPVTNSDRPENLNEIKLSMDYAIEHLKKLFNNFNGFSLETDNNWVSNYAGQLNIKYTIFPKPGPGFEKALSVMHYKWNPGEKEGANASYHKKVLNNSKKFLPRSN